MIHLKTHRPTDWRRLNLDHSVRPRRCHNRHVYGELQPMDEPEGYSIWHWLFLAPFLIWALVETIGVMV